MVRFFSEEKSEGEDIRKIQGSDGEKTFSYKRPNQGRDLFSDMVDKFSGKNDYTKM